MKACYPAATRQWLSASPVVHSVGRGFWEMLIVFLLLSALTAIRTGLVQCEESEETEAESQTTQTEAAVPVSEDESFLASLDFSTTPSTDFPVAWTSLNDTKREIYPTWSLLSIIILIPLVLMLLLVSVVVVICHRMRGNDTDIKEDRYLHDNEHEKVPMPMFDDDIPSVMELEMEDLENWMGKEPTCRLQVEE